MRLRTAAPPSSADPGRGRSTKQVAVLLILAVVGALALMGLGAVFDPSPGYSLALPAAAAVSYVVHIYLHELGHLIAAVGMRLPVIEVAVLAMPASKRRSVGGVFVAFGLFGTLSHVKTGWPRRQQGIQIRHCVLYLAGPAANIGTAAMFYVLGMSAEPGVRGIALTVSVVGVLAGLATLIPKRYATGLNSDGANLLRLLLGNLRHFTDLAPETVRVLAELRDRSTSSGNRWRTYEDLGIAMRLRAELADSARPSSEPSATAADTLGQ